MNLLRPDRLEPLARDYALGTLTGGARRRFERLLHDSPVARRAALVWQDRLAALSTAVPPLAPRPALWSALEQRLFAPAQPRRRAWLGWLGGALVGVAGTSVVVRLLPGTVGLEPAGETLPASYVGLLADETGRPVLLASARRHGRTLVLKWLRPPAPDAAATLWALPRDGSPAFAVGALPAGGSGVLPLPRPAEQIFFGVDRLQLRIAGREAPLLAGHCVRLW